MKHIGLFEGIGGFSLAARWMGWETVAWCEIDEFCQRVLKHHFPYAEALTDIKQTDFKKYANAVDIVTGGFPCQPFSHMGKWLGTEDDRYLWPQMLRAILEIQPVWVVGENVRRIVNWSGGLVFDKVQADLEAEGYEVMPFLLPACAVGASHERERMWFIAYSPSRGLEKSKGRPGCERKVFREAPNDFLRSIDAQWDKRNRLSGKVRKHDGFPIELDGITFPKLRDESIMAFGNAVVPQVVMQIYKAIEQYELL
jgi:DNA (cytosine-5)-methyltransferase 1